MQTAPIISIATLRCGGCGSADIVAVDPGDEPVYAPGGILIDAGRPVTARCLACWAGPREEKPRALECYRCAGTSDDGVTFARHRKPRGRPLLCADCAADPARPVPVFVRGTYRRHEVTRAASAQMDIENAARGGA
jgi:hypothetical protein